MAGVNTKIDKDDYNAIQTVIGRILGTGSGNTGYGQTVLSSQVTQSDSVTVNEYAALRYDIININKHIYNAAPSGINDQTIGAKVRYDITNAPINYWLSLATSLDIVRFTLPPAGQRVSINHGTTTFTGTWGSNSNPQLACTVTVEFTNSEQARYFFNSGSSIQFTSSRSGGSSTAQNISWTTLLSTAGARIFGGGTPGTGTSPADGQNFFRLTNVGQTWSNVVASSPYALNEFSITAQTDDAIPITNNSTGTSKKLKFEVFWNDNHFPLGGNSATGTPVQPGGFGPDNVDGTVSLTVQTVKASGVLEPSGSGNFTIETPTVTIGTIIN